MFAEWFYGGKLHRFEVTPRARKHKWRKGSHGRCTHRYCSDCRKRYGENRGNRLERHRERAHLRALTRGDCLPS
jgi:hypothetical protein